MEATNRFRYGMKNRGYSPGCQPMDGLVAIEIDKTGKYYNILVYGRALSTKEIKDYELEPVAPTNFKKMRLKKGLSQSEVAKLSGVSVKTIQLYDQVPKKFNVAVLQKALKIAEAFGCEVEELMD